MPHKKGKIVLMGSGELTTTMVEVHKALLRELPDAPRPLFLDTPAGFQLNVGQISEKALAYFRDHVQQPMAVASYRSKETIAPYEAEEVFQTLGHANYFLIGPGSPTYAVRQWAKTPIPEILVKRIQEGCCLVAASAAALTVGRFTLPVYEIYKVGDDLYWKDGMNILASFGFNMVVIPHWNNAEGGTHDTRFCYMGAPRLKRLEALLPKDISILGLDEHTACILDLEKEEFMVKGIGRLTLRRNGAEQVFEKGDCFPLEILKGKGTTGEGWKPAAHEPAVSEPIPDAGEGSFWKSVHDIENRFQKCLEEHNLKETTNSLLELDQTIWQATQDLENDEDISQAREILRELIVSFGVRLDSVSEDRTECLAPLVEKMLSLREKFRKARQWEAADAIRQCLQTSNIVIEDDKDGTQWYLKETPD